MKLFMRTLAILAAALVVVAGLYAVGQSSLGQQLRAAGPEQSGFSREGGSPAEAGGERPAGFEGNGEHAGHGPSLLGLVEAGKNLAIVAVSVVLVALGARLLRLGQRDRGERTPPDQPHGAAL